MSSAEFSGWLEYLRIDDKVKADWIAYAIVKAFNGDKKQANGGIDEDEEIIDTTDPDFAKNFKGFTNVPGGNSSRVAPQRMMPPRQMSTDIKLG